MLVPKMGLEEYECKIDLENPAQETDPFDDLTIDNLFDKCDIDKNGYISRTELKVFLGQLKEKKKISCLKFDRIYLKADINQDNKIDRDEFRALIKDPLFQSCLKRYCDIFLPSSHRKEEYQCNVCPPPIGMITITIIQLILFLVDSKDTVRWFNSEHLALDPKQKTEIWRYITYMFVHDGWMHLIWNLIIQAVLGTALEIFHRPWRILLIYFFGGIAAALGTSLFQPDVRLVGASGGVYAIIASYIATTFLNFSEMYYPIIQLLVFTIGMSLDFAQSFYILINQEAKYQTGYIAHICGGISGLLSGIFILRNFKVKGYEVLVQKIATVAFVTYISVGIYFNYFFS